MKNLPSITQSFLVQYDYQLHFTEGIFKKDNELFASILGSSKGKKSSRILFVIDENVSIANPDLEKDIAAYCALYSSLQLANIFMVPGGEASKNSIIHVEKIQSLVNSEHVCRHSYIVAIGGGAVIDMVGYAAATSHRGVKLVRIPTTVLAQNDAAVGVKNGINCFGKKNFVGTFAVPHAIINDFNFLDTLEQRDWISGVAEAVKVALIKDAGFFDFLEKNAKVLATRDKEAMAATIHRCAEIHMQHIAKNGDPFESGSSRPLDFGHWAAHKLEQMTEYQLRHGEAVAMGIALDVTYAHLIGMLNKAQLKRILKTLTEVGFNLAIPLSTEKDFRQLLQGLEEFREHLGGQLTITLISEIGKQLDVHEIDTKKMLEAISIRSIPKQALSC